MQKILKSAAFMTVPLMIACGVLAQADEWDKKTTITVNQRIEVPGAVLPAGTYVFKLVDSPSDRHIVQVFNERQDQVFATVLAIPNYRLRPTGKTVMTFYEVPAGEAQPVRAWFYPGDDYGQEFVYPKGRNLSIAQNTSTTTTTPLIEQPAPAPPPEVAQVAPPPAPEEPAPAPAPQPEVAQNEPPPAPAPAPAPAAPVMPQTASNVPLLTMLGLLSIGGALGLSVFVKRIG